VSKGKNRKRERMHSVVNEKVDEERLNQELSQISVTFDDSNTFLQSKKPKVTPGDAELRRKVFIFSGIDAKKKKRYEASKKSKGALN
jgi:hypothetical protein